MSSWILLQLCFDIILLIGLVAAWVRLTKPTEDDPRLSRGLQLLQAKISVLEDLSDRTEVQVAQLMALMEGKAKEVQNQILLADKHIQFVEASIAKGMEVVKIFQDRIPHQEIVDRKNVVKYVKAARLAHQGISVDAIAEQVDLSRSEIEFITKVNRDNLQFSEKDLPEWINEEGESWSQEQLPLQMLSQPQILPKSEDRAVLTQLGDRFRQALGSSQGFSVAPPQVIVPEAAVEVTKTAKKIGLSSEVVTGQNKLGERIHVKKVLFPKVKL